MGSLSAYALTSLAAARDYIGGVPETNGIWIYCPAAGATAATAEISDTLLTLIITGGASAATKTFDLTAAANDTITELVAAINAYALPATPTAVYPWKAGAITNGSALSTDLIVTGAQSALGAANELTLRIDDNYGLTELINRSSDFIEKYCGRRFKTRSYDRVPYVGNGRPAMVLRQYPVTRVYRVSAGRTNAFYVTNTTAVNFATVEVDSTKVRLNADGTVSDKTLATYATINLLIAAINATSGWTATLVAEGTRCPYYTGSDGTTKVSELIPMPAQRCMSPNVAYVEVPDDDIDDYQVIGGGMDEDRDAGMLYRAGGWANGETFLIDSVCGFSTIPSCLEEACLMLVKYAKDKASHSSDIQSEGLGDYQYSIGVLGNTFGKEMLDQIKMFRAFEF